MVDPERSENVFQRWKEGGEQLPFKVIVNWDPATSAFLVERIELKGDPTGRLGTRSIRNGVATT
jgi:hypothetical protein